MLVILDVLEEVVSVSGPSGSVMVITIVVITAMKILRTATMVSGRFYRRLSAFLSVSDLHRVSKNYANLFFVRICQIYTDC